MGRSTRRLSAAAVLATITLFAGCGGENGMEPPSCEDTGTCPTPPVAPTGLAATAVDQTQVNLTWTDASDDEDGFRIERRLQAGGTFAQIAAPAAGATTYSDGGLSSETGYCYRVLAHNEIGDSPWTTENCATTEAEPPPAAPTDLVAVAIDDHQINIAWTDTSDDEDGFRIERRLEAGGTYEAHVEVAADDTSHGDATLDPETGYCYRILAFNDNGDSPWSNEACATTGAAPAPAGPTNLLAAGHDQRIDLTWTDASDNEDGFRIQRRVWANFDWVEVGTAPANAESYSDSGLPVWAPFCYRVQAYNDLDSPWTTVANAWDDCATTFPPLIEAGELYCPEGKEYLPVVECVNKCNPGERHITVNQCQNVSTGEIRSHDAGVPEPVGCYREGYSPVNPPGLAFNGCTAFVDFPTDGRESNSPPGHRGNDQDPFGPCDEPFCYDSDAPAFGVWGYNCGKDRFNAKSISDEVDHACWNHDFACWSAAPNGNSYAPGDDRDQANWMGFGRYLANIRTTDPRIARAQFNVIQNLHNTFIQEMTYKNYPAWKFEGNAFPQDQTIDRGLMSCPAPADVSDEGPWRIDPGH